MSLLHANLRVAETCEVLVAVSESNMSHDVFFFCYDEGTQACSYHGMRNETGAGADRGHGDHACKLRVHEVPGAYKTVSVSPAGKVQAWFLVVGGNPGGRDVIHPIPRVRLLEERPAVSRRRKKTQRGELQCQVVDDTAGGLIVKIMKVLLVTSLGQCGDRLCSA